MNARTLLLMVAGVFFLSLMGVFAKLATNHLPFLEVVFGRGVLGVLCLVPLARHRKVGLFGKRRRLLAMRGLFGFVAVACYVFALSRISLADVVATNRIAPILMVLLAHHLLGEAVPRSIYLIAGLAFLGALTVIRPGFGLANLGGAAALCSAVCSAVAFTLVKILSDESKESVVFYQYFFSMILAGLLGAHEFVLPDLATLGLLLGMSGFSVVGQLLTTEGYQHGLLSRVSLLTFLSVIFSAGWDLLVWGQVPDLWSALGAVLVLLSCLWLGLS